MAARAFLMVMVAEAFLSRPVIKCPSCPLATKKKKNSPPEFF
jgi:hypothetical protein